MSHNIHTFHHTALNQRPTFRSLNVFGFCFSVERHTFTHAQYYMAAKLVLLSRKLSRILKQCQPKTSQIANYVVSPDSLSLSL